MTKQNTTYETTEANTQKCIRGTALEQPVGNYWVGVGGAGGKGAAG